MAVVDGKGVLVGSSVENAGIAAVGLHLRLVLVQIEGLKMSKLRSLTLQNRGAVKWNMGDEVAKGVPHEGRHCQGHKDLEDDGMMGGE